ncbi:rod shape-determining protein MreD [Simiduia curdlanivorans]|uniref:Rod shape-determining protein MreD n=1 Tax=Simiduia curdlanivorans TaxID=1492769 RepID=A0ABV8V6Q1_9GAMM|nr:rod shape-determining protein MreD [Simiduia curdlanivorans]MDN3638908.1 rod shape-determining protein MreD [Simiduia curdlanivorans]
MQAPKPNNLWVLPLMLALGLLLAVWPMGSWSIYRPAWIVLLCTYWVLALPYRVGLVSLCLVGLLQDIVEGGMLGFHALSLVLIGYVCLLSYQRLRNYAPWQQAGWVFVLVGMQQVIGNWVNSLSGHEYTGLDFLLPALTSALCWPGIHRSQQWLRRRYKVT